MIFELISAGLIFIILVLSSLVPYVLLSAGSTRPKGTLLLSLCNCVACGIFLSTCFLGLIPHVRHHEKLLHAALRNETLTEQCQDGSQEKHLFLSTENVVLAGFIIILLLEQAIFTCSGHGHGHSGSPNRAGDHSLLRLDGDAGLPLVLHGFDDDEVEGDDIVFRKECTPEHHASAASSGHHGHSHAIVLHDGLTMRTLLLLLGLSIHSVFEGVALGLQKDRGDFVKIMLAIMLHEVLCCLAFGLSLAAQAANRKAAVLSTMILSACIPVGMCAAFLVDIFDSTHSLLLRFLLEGLAAGTFIYVAAAEMMPAELGHAHGKEGFFKSLAVTAGVVIFFTFQYSFGH